MSSEPVRNGHMDAWMLKAVSKVSKLWLRPKALFFFFLANTKVIFI